MKENRTNPAVKSIILVAIIVIVSVVIAFSVIYVGSDYLGIGAGRGNDCVVEIPQGASTATIAEKLKEVGAVKVPLAFRLYSRIKGYDSQYKYGVYTFDNEIGYESLAVMLTENGAKAESKRVKIPEMATVDDIAKLLSEAGVCESADFIDAVQNAEYNFDFVNDIPREKVYYRLEGYLFPDTYDFYSYDSKECAVLAVNKMLSNLESKLDDEIKNKISNSNYTFHELMTMASIVESESANGTPEERSKVARVFYNRLEGVNWSGPKFLQTDPTTHYPHGDRRYNTYEKEGLPPGPIGSPSLNSIRATLSPKEDFKATYFVTDINADFYFNTNLAGHEKTIADLKSKGLWLYTTLG